MYFEFYILEIIISSICRRL